MSAPSLLLPTSLGYCNWLTECRSHAQQCLVSWFCRLTGGAIVKISSEKKMTALCGNFRKSCLARLSRVMQFATVSSYARRFLTHFNCKSCRIMQDTDDRCIPVSLEICRVVWWDCGAPSWLNTISSTTWMFSSVRAVLGRPLPALRSAKPVSLSCFRKSFSVVFEPFVGNSFINFLAP